MADKTFPAEICQNPLPLLAAVIGVLGASEESPALPDESKGQVTEAICYLAERLATLQALVDPSTPAVTAAILTPTGTRRAPARLMLNDIARGLARRVPLTKLVELDGDVRPYLAALMIAALHKAGDALVVPDGMTIRKVTEEQFDNMLVAEAGKAYDNYGIIGRDLVQATAPQKKLTNSEQDRIQRERLNDILSEVVRVLDTFDTAEDPAPGGGQMVTPVITGDSARISAAVVGVAKKIEDNVRRVVTAAAAQPAHATVTPGSAVIK